ncbi:MAG: NAD-dependent epimerase/dehydratase family protein [Chlorobiaceae bacterium]|nr:NAD-dependent epimerase/dehydratase family protein [Chlorobiaceae bacterium]NTV61289.1 NAD-dependent epimerase/dehydratase family protein [Chlorobiaceae bacterium]
MQKSSIAITGATGYIGSQVILTLLSKFGPELSCRAIVRESSDCSFLENLPVEKVVADILDPLALDEAFRGVDTVFHCAGLISYTKSSRRSLYETNVEGTRNVVNACLAAHVSKLVMTSSIAALGVTDDGSPASESATFKDWQHRNGYMEAKYLAELEGLRGVAEGLDVVMLNPGVVIGTDHGNRASSSSSNGVLRLIYDGKLPLLPSGGTGFVDVRDVAEAHIAAWKKGRSGERYIVVARNFSFRELFEHIRDLEGSRNRNALSIPPAAGFVAGLGGELWSLFSGTPSFISLESLRLSGKLLQYDNSRSLEELGIRYRDFSETLMTIIT